MERLTRLTNLPALLVAQVPKLKRGRVWCLTCGQTERIDSAAALLDGRWPKHCGVTMSIDSPEERKGGS